jgi:hypothetical protein
MIMSTLSRRSFCKSAISMSIIVMTGCGHQIEPKQEDLVMHTPITPESPKCETCHAFLAGLSYVMQDFYLWVTKVAPDMHICQGWRGQVEQHEYFEDGKSDLDWPNSAHNNMENEVPFSEAIDLFVLSPEGQALWPVDRYQDLYNQAVLSSQPIFWGGEWKNFKDLDHFQNSSWKVP